MGLLAQYRAVKKTLAKLQAEMMIIAGTFERFKNVFTWEDPKRTWIWLGILVLLFSVTRVLTFRWVMIIGRMTCTLCCG